MIFDFLLSVVLNIGKFFVGLLPVMPFPESMDITGYLSALHTQLEYFNYFFPFQALLVVMTFAITVLTVRFGIAIMERILNRRIMP